MKEATTADLVELYIKFALIHGKSLLSGDSKVNRKAHNDIARIYSELRRRGLESQSALLHLLDHKEAHVRLWAASHALEFAPSEGVPALLQLSKSGGIIAFDAEMTLQEWRNGNLEFP